jgi:hypothetical protein
MPLECSGERSPAITEGTGARVHELPRGPSGHVAADFVLNAGTVVQLAIERQRGCPVRFRYRRTIVGKAGGPEPFLAEAKLLPE